MFSTSLPDTLFGPDATALRDRLEDAYADQLLANPPVGMVRADHPRREVNARFLAHKDISRMVQALESAGLVLAEGKPL